jgi:hypothetical protein
MFGMPQLGTALGLEMGSWGDPEHRGVHIAISDAVNDLDDTGLLASSGTYGVSATPEARRYRTHSLRELWPNLRAGHLEPDEEAYLAKLAELSEAEHEDWVEVRRMPSREVFAALGWDWDRTRSLRITRVLQHGQFAHVQSTNDMDNPRLSFAGAVRASDEVGSALAEARDHLSVGRPRAAGCVAGVELERRLKDLCRDPAIKVTGKLPTIADYNDALRKARVYPQATWRKIQHLADLRNRCAHVLDIEPTEADAQELVEGVDAVMRGFA